MDKNEKITVFIVDDEIKAQEALKSILAEDAPEFTLIGSAQTIKEAYVKINQLKPDVVFLDIELQHEMGFDLLNLQYNCHFETVFVTAHDQYSLAAFKSNALSYLLKPITFSEFNRVKQRILQVISQQSNLENRSNYLSSGEWNRISVPTGNRIEFFEEESIIMIQADRSYCTIHLYGGETKTVSKPLAYFAKHVSPNNFLRIHRSYLVNIKHIQAWDKVDGGRLILRNTSVPVSTEGRKALHQLLDQ